MKKVKALKEFSSLALGNVSKGQVFPLSAGMAEKFAAAGMVEVLADVPAPAAEKAPAKKPASKKAAAKTTKE